MRDDETAPKARERWSARAKGETVLRILRGESMEVVSREVRAPLRELQEWHDRFLEVELRRAQQKIGELTMGIELHEGRGLCSQLGRGGPSDDEALSPTKGKRYPSPGRHTDAACAHYAELAAGRSQAALVGPAHSSWRVPRSSTSTQSCGEGTLGACQSPDHTASGADPSAELGGRGRSARDTQ